MIQSVERAFMILGMLYENQAGDGLGISAISKALKLKLPTAHNLMRTLVQLGYAEQHGDGKYFAGPKAGKFGMRSSSSLLELARPHIDALVDHINETALLAVHHDKVRYILYQKECSRRLRVYSENWPNSNFFGTSTGLAMLSGCTP